MPLVRRTSRAVAFTDRGEEFLDRARALLRAAHAAERSVHDEAPGGVLKVSVPVPMGRLLSGSVIARFGQRMPNVRLEINLDDARVDLVRQGFDLAIRGGPLADSTLIARRLTSASLWLYASARFRADRLEDIPLVAGPPTRLGCAAPRSTRGRPRSWWTIVSPSPAPWSGAQALLSYRRSWDSPCARPARSTAWVPPRWFPCPCTPSTTILSGTTSASRR